MLCMLCQQKPARVHLTRIDSVSKTQSVVHLCEDCARQQGVDKPAGFSMTSLIRMVEGRPGGAKLGDKPGANL